MIAWFHVIHLAWWVQLSSHLVSLGLSIWVHEDGISLSCHYCRRLRYTFAHYACTYVLSCIYHLHESFGSLFPIFSRFSLLFRLFHNCNLPRYFFGKLFISICEYYPIPFEMYLLLLSDCFALIVYSLSFISRALLHSLSLGKQWTTMNAFENIA